MSGLPGLEACEEEVRIWYNRNRPEGYWSGAILDLEWEELWPDAQDWLRRLYWDARAEMDKTA